MRVPNFIKNSIGLVKNAVHKMNPAKELVKENALETAMPNSTNTKYIKNNNSHQLHLFFSDPNKAHEITQGYSEWHSVDLEKKSSEELQGLWYSLLLEKNMLLTMQHEAFLQESDYALSYNDKIAIINKSFNNIKAELDLRNEKLISQKLEETKDEEEKKELENILKNITKKTRRNVKN